MENIIKEVIGILEGTEIASELEAISCFFVSVQQDFDHFMQKFGISCPSGCGSCCEHFIPDLTRSEALIIASFIIKSERKDELMDMLQRDSDGCCPMYNKNDESHHCSIYAVRPLLCRMFLSACSSDKNGINRFSYCSNYGAALGIAQNELKPFHPMAYYGERLRELPGNSSDTLLLPDAVRRSLGRIGLGMMYAGLYSDDGGESNPA